MQVAITGSSGLIGGALAASLAGDGHKVRPLVRSPGDATDDPDAIYWEPTGGELNADHLEGVEAVVHLAGVGIGDRRWTAKHKRAVWDSRIDGTGLIARTLAALDEPPKVLVCGSAIGYYGDRGDEVLTETSEAGSGFLAELVQAWEAATKPAEDAGVRVVHARSGLVLSGTGGLLRKLVLPFKLGLGGRTGRGTQWMSWVTLTDEVRALRFLLEAEDVSGPVNLTAPQPVVNQELARALGRAVHRPTFLPTPVFALKLAMGGQLVQELMLASQRVDATVLGEAGFTFEHRDIDTALTTVLAKR
jgi:hypothetical protein